jgi:hypothetical protein
MNGRNDSLMSASRQESGTKRKAKGATYVLPKRRSANAIFVPLWSTVAILGAGWEQPDNKKIVAGLLAIGAGWVAMAIASQHLRLAGRRTTPAKALGILLIVTLCCLWAWEYWLRGAPLSAISRIMAFVGMAASLALSITISILGLCVAKPDAATKHGA